MDFKKLVKIIVEPVLVSFKFIIKQEIKGIVEYDNGNLVITLSYDYSSSYEVDITLLFKENGLFYGYDELKEYFYNSKYNRFATQIKDEYAMIKWLEEVKKFLQDNLNSIIDNYKEIQVGLQRIRQSHIDNYENERNSRLLNEGVEKYWMAKDYSGLVKFLRNHNRQLEGNIKQKFEYALKMINEK